MVPRPLSATVSGRTDMSQEELLERHPDVALSIRAVLSKAHATLLADDPAHALTSTLEAANALFDSVTQLSLRPSEMRPTPPVRRSNLSGEPSSDSPHEGSTPHVTKELAGQVVNSELLCSYLQGQYSSDLAHLVALVEILYALRDLIRPEHFAFDWWDVLLRPVLKNEAVGLGTAAKARDLTISAMNSAPKSFYPDEPRPQGALGGMVIRDALFNPLLGESSSPSSARPMSGRARSSSEPGALLLPSSLLPHSRHSGKDPKAFAQRIFDLYVSEFTPLDDESRDLSAWQYNLQETLLKFGERSPTRFFYHVAESLSHPEARLVLFDLLVTFFTLAPDLIYLITRTKLVQKLMWSLQLDTAPSVLIVGLRVVTMLIPHIPDWIGSGGAGGLPAFFFVLARVLDWSRPLDHGDFPAEEDQGDERLNPEMENGRRPHAFHEAWDKFKLKPGFTWERKTPAGDERELGAPDPQPLFTFLYGIFPCNTISFIRNPVVCLEESRYESPYQLPWTSLVDKNRVQKNVLPILKRHALHPALIQCDAQEELTDKMRWEEHDPNTATVQSVRLYLDPYRQPPEEFPTFSLDEQNPVPYSKRQASPRLPLDTPGSEAETEEGVPVCATRIIGQYASIKRDASFTGRHRPDTLASPALSHKASRTMISPRSPSGKFDPVSRDALAAETREDDAVSDRTGAKPAIPLRGRRSLRDALLTDRAWSTGTAPVTKVEVVHAAFSHGDVDFSQGSETEETLDAARLQRENMLLRGELAYEHFLQGQHLRHIGHVHNKRVAETSMLAEEEDRKHRIRQLTDQLNEAELAYRLEHDRFKAAVRGYKAWQASQGMRFTNHSQKERAWRRERAQLLTQVEALTVETARLSSQVQLEAQDKERFRADLELQQPELEKCKAYGERVRQLTAALAHWDEDLDNYHLQRREMLALLSHWDTMVRQYATVHQRVIAAEACAAEAHDRATDLAQKVAQLEGILAEQQAGARALLGPRALPEHNMDVDLAREQGAQEERQRVSHAMFQMQCEIDTLRIYEQMANLCDPQDHQ